MLERCLERECNIWTLRLIVIAGITGVYGVFPEASQEGMLHPFKSYADVTLFHYNVPPEVSRSTWEFAAFMDNPKCPVKEVHIYIQHGSYPVMSPTNSSFPSSVYTGRTSLHYIATKSAYQPHDATIFPVNNPLPGNWFVAAYISHWDQHVQQEGIGHKCHYSLGSVALWSQVMGIPVISPGVPKIVTTVDHFSYYKIFIPAGTWHFSVKISNCEFEISSVALFHNNSSMLYCIQSLALRARALPSYNPLISVGNLTEDAEYIFTETEPYTDSFYYLLVISESQVSFKVDVTTTECSVQALGRSFAKQFAQMTESLSQTVTIRHSNNTVRTDWANTILFANDSEMHNLSKLNSIPRVQTEDDFERDDPCLPTFQLARIKHAQDFADTFLLQGREWYTSWVALTDVLPVVVQLEILPFVDIGGTLSVNIHLNELLVNTSHQLLTVTACIRKGRVPSRVNRDIECSTDLLLSVSSKNSTTMDATKLIPYPEPDMWFIAFQAKCYANGSAKPCMVNEVMVSLNIRTQPCLFAGEPCGLKGVCQESHKGLHFFTSCACLGGYQGWGCTDGSSATPEGLLLLTTLLLTLSNVFFLPAVLLALRRNLLTEALVYMATMVFSTFYHACDQDFYAYCVTKYEVLQFCDFFCSILAFWVTLIAIAGIPSHVASTLHMIGVLIIAVGVEYNRTGLLVFIIPFGLGVVIPRGCIHLQCSLVLLLLPGILLATVGLVLFAFIETEANYQYVHSAWHIVIALSLVFLLPKKCSQQRSGPHKTANDAELFDINDYYSASPVFIVSSDLDNLLTSQS
ncbi:post-GPI attachment to proteins factor 6 isoform X2 [Anabrus simplex]|uniref:post-GPI attachment to proteins factor 6 isoform X2 n=1 Tax=Anabrus simplex TaxID=316456 RepID=UPI0034DD5346